MTEEEFGMGYLDLKPATSVAAKSLGGNSLTTQNGSAPNTSQYEPAGGRTLDVKDPNVLRLKSMDGKLERTESSPLKVKGSALVNGSDLQSTISSSSVPSGTSKLIENHKQHDESTSRTLDESAKVAPKNFAESEVT